MNEKYKIEYSREVSKVIDDMAREEGVDVTELLRRALNFYEVRLDVSGLIEHVIF